MNIITDANGNIVLLNDGTASNAIGLPTDQAIQLNTKFAIPSKDWAFLSNQSAAISPEFTYQFVDAKNKSYVLIPQYLDANKNYFVFTDNYNTDSWHKNRWYKSIKIKYDGAVTLNTPIIDGGFTHKTVPGYQVIFINWKGEEKLAATVSMWNNAVYECRWNTNNVSYFSDLVSGFPDYTFFIATVSSSGKVEPALIDFTDTTSDWINLLLLNKKQIVES